MSGFMISWKPSAIAGSVLLWAGATGVAVQWLHLSTAAALLGGLVCVALHWLSDLIHHGGHAWAARRTGFPMVGVRLWGLLGTSLYPADEPQLPAAVHIRRALGGPAASLVLTLVAALVALALRPWNETPGWVSAFFFLDNLLIFTLGAFIPLRFTDGGTLLTWWGKR